MPALGRAFVRLFFVQGSWNYEWMSGLGFGVSAVPLLKSLASERGEEAFHAAVARAARFFNAHPYLTGLAVGAQARAEHDGVDPEQIERLRNALPGPLGSVGDRAVWAGWLPATVAGALLLAALGAGWPLVVVFLVSYNVVHVGLRLWGLVAGWKLGIRVPDALAWPPLRWAVRVMPLAACFLLGVALPMVAEWTMFLVEGRDRWGVAVIGLASLIVIRWIAPGIGGLRVALFAIAAALLGGVLWR